MTYKISKNKVEEILSSVDLINVARLHLKLTGNGNGLYATCPFHKGWAGLKLEKSPSLCFQKDVQLYRCFGCGETGNAITFLMSYEKISFIKAIRKLSNIGGIKLR
jgi:DNA primase